MRTRTTWRAGACLAVLLAGAASFGCNGDDKNGNGAIAHDPSAELITITASLDVDPPTKDLNQDTGTRWQWYNAGTEPVTIFIDKSAIQFELEGGHYSQVFITNSKATRMGYEYQVERGASKPPNPPSLNVGP